MAAVCLGPLDCIILDPHVLFEVFGWISRMDLDRGCLHSILWYGSPFPLQRRSHKKIALHRKFRHRDTQLARK